MQEVRERVGVVGTGVPQLDPAGVVQARIAPPQLSDRQLAAPARRTAGDLDRVGSVVSPIVVGRRTSVLIHLAGTVQLRPVPSGTAVRSTSRSTAEHCVALWNTFVDPGARPHGRAAGRPITEETDQT